MEKLTCNIKTAYLEKPVLLLLILNILDLILTYAGLKSGYIKEINPILNHIYMQGDIFFILVKISVTLSSCYAIGYGIKKFKWVKKAVYIPVAVYLIVLIMHIYVIKLSW